MRRSRSRHLPRRRRRLRFVLLLLWLVVLGASGAVVFHVTRPVPRIGVTVVVAGAPRAVRVMEPATVGSALAEADVVPQPGRLLSVVSASVLDPALTPVQLLVDGLPAAPETPVLAGATIAVIEPPDETEAAVDGQEVIPAPPMPDVINGLWHPGQPGLALTRKGALSGELVARQEVQPPVSPAIVTQKLVALTFDDGPMPATPEILRILREKDVKATFCVVTRLLNGDALAVIKQAIAEGHHVCNHTVGHDQALPRKSQKVIDAEIAGANRDFSERLGMKPTYYRPPGGNLGPNVLATAKAEGQQVLMWTVDTKDYRKPPPEEIVTTVMTQVQPGGVVLLHDGGGDRAPTVAALPVLIDQLRAAGYQLVLPAAVAPVAPAPITATALPV